MLSCRYQKIDAQAEAFMKGNEDKFPLEKAEKDKILQHLDKFSKSAKMRDAALALYVNAKVSHLLHRHLLPFPLLRNAPFPVPSSAMRVWSCLKSSHHTSLQLSS